MRLPGVKQTRNKKQETGNKKRGIRFKFGFSLIELLIVISLFGLSASMITAAYLTFERKQKIKNVAIDLKNNLRLTQNKAHTGDKGENFNCDFPGPPPPTASQTFLKGWYLKIDNTGTDWNSYTDTYSIEPYCFDQSDNDRVEDVSPFPDALVKTITLPDGLKISGINNYTPGNPPGFISPKTNIYILFQPLTNDSKFYSAKEFFDSNGNDINTVGTDGDTLRITLERDSGDVYYVDIAAGGDINESK